MLCNRSVGLARSRAKLKDRRGVQGQPTTLNVSICTQHMIRACLEVFKGYGAVCKTILDKEQYEEEE